MLSQGGTMMWKYIRRYLPFAILAGIFMVGEVLMDLVQPGIMSRIVDDGVLELNRDGVGDLHLIWLLGLQMIALVLFGGFCGALNNVFVHLSGQNIGNDMRKDCFRKIMTFSFPQVNHFGTGSLVARVTNDITQVQNLVSQFVRGMIRTTMLTFGSMYCMFRLNVRFGEIVLCAFPFLVGTLAVCLRRANPLFSKLQDQLDQINAIMQEDVSGIRMIKACVRELYEKKRFGKANDALVKTQLKTLVIFAFMNPVVNALMYLVVAGILLAGSFEVGKGATTPGAIMAAITYTTQLLNGILMLVMLFQNISKGTASWKRVKEILHSAPDLSDGTFDGKTEKQGEIEFCDVSFSYPGTNEKILSHINFSVHKGETVAIMGATGCGKTTMVNLLMRFYDIDSGEICINEQNIKDMKREELRKNIAIVLQDTVLFSDTLRSNLKYGKENATEEELENAVAMSHCSDLLRHLPKGYDTVLTGAGSNISQGQRQLIAIARAFVADPKILIFDEATSNVDTRTEKAIQTAMQKIMQGRTSIVIAHRLSTIRDSDLIVVMDHGKIVESGTHEALLEQKGKYYELYRTQYSGFAT